MSQITRKSSKIKAKLNPSDKITTKSNTRRSKRARLPDAHHVTTAASTVAVSTTATAAAATAAAAAAAATAMEGWIDSSAANACEVEIKEEEEEEDAADIKPDVDELNKQLNEASSVVLPQSVLPTLFIISQLPTGFLANATAAINTDGTGASLHCGPATLPGRGSGGGGGGGLGSSNGSASAAPTKFSEDVHAQDEFDLHESDSDEHGYSDVDLGDDDELIEDDDEVDCFDPPWTDQPTAPRMICNFKTQQHNVGLHGRPTCLNPIFYIEKVLSPLDEFFRRVTSSSNAHARARAQQQMAANAGGLLGLQDISGDEMRVFFGICLQMSAMKLRTLADYWNEHALWGFQGFGGKMSLKRFELIMSVLSFDHLLMSSRPNAEAGEGASPASAGGAGDFQRDPAFATVQPLVDFFNARMEQIYVCGQRVVLNDPIVFWKGRFSWHSDMSTKFRCNSILLHQLTEYTGLIHRLALDVERIERRANERNSKLLVAQRVALAKQLLSTRLGKGHTVYASKYYGSYALAHELSAHQTYCTGFVDVKRYGNCKELILTNLEPKTFATKYAGSIMMGKWRNRYKSEYFFSSDCLAIYANETSLRTADRKPKIVKELNWQLNWKLNEDMKENLTCYQLGLEHKELKWDRQLAVYVFNLMVFNAYILYIMHAQLGRTRFTELHLRDRTILKTYAEFRQEFVRILLSDGSESQQPEGGAPGEAKKKRTTSVQESADDEDEQEQEEPVGEQQQQQSNAASLLEVEHRPMIIPRRQGKVMKKKCRVCRKAGMLTFSKSCCEACPGMPGLCETPCFKMWHEQLRKSLEVGGCIKTRVFGKSGKETIYF